MIVSGCVLKYLRYVWIHWDISIYIQISLCTIWYRDILWVWLGLSVARQASGSDSRPQAQSDSRWFRLWLAAVTASPSPPTPSQSLSLARSARVRTQAPGVSRVTSLGYDLSHCWPAAAGAAAVTVRPGLSLNATVIVTPTRPSNRDGDSDWGLWARAGLRSV